MNLKIDHHLDKFREGLIIYQTLYVKPGDSIYVILFLTFQEIFWTFDGFLEESSKCNKNDIRICLNVFPILKHF